MQNTMSSQGAVKNVAPPQCQFFVVRKKRLCRMTVRPGRYYCGEHEPQPASDDGQEDTRIPCPNDPKHSCYISKLDKHLSICNARVGKQPPYIQYNINNPATQEEFSRTPLSGIPRETLMQVIDKIHILYEKHVKDKITTLREYEIHPVVLEEFNEQHRTDSSLRHLRQASQLLWIMQDVGLVNHGTCYVELGAGKGQLSWYASLAWCGGGGGRVVVVDRAALRHKRDNRVRDGSVVRVRADLAHLRLHAVEHVPESCAVVGFAKHLCGVATDFALRCVSGCSNRRGVVIATCCHHRCVPNAYVASTHLQKLGITREDLNVMLGIVSWATCGDGRSRDTRKHEQTSTEQNEHTTTEHAQILSSSKDQLNESMSSPDDHLVASELNSSRMKSPNVQTGTVDVPLSQEYRETMGRECKALLDWGRTLYLREQGFEARLCYYVPTSVSLENVCIVATRAL